MPTTPTNSGTSPGLGRRGELLVAVQFALMIGFAVLPVWQAGLPAEFLAATAPWRTGAGLLFGLIAVVLAGLGSHHLRDYLTPLPYPVDHSQLVQQGVYAIVRHPLYASLMNLGIAWTLYNASLSHLLAMVPVFLFFDYKARKEERWLTERHPEYAGYARRVRKFVPWVY